MKKIIFAVFATAMLSGCAVSSPPDVLAKRNPADARTGNRGPYYRPVITDYTHRAPVDPKSWRKLNDEQSPKKEKKS